VVTYSCVISCEFFEFRFPNSKSFFVLILIYLLYFINYTIFLSFIMIITFSFCIFCTNLTFCYNYLSQHVTRHFFNNIDNFQLISYLQRSPVCLLILDLHVCISLFLPFNYNQFMKLCFTKFINKTAAIFKFNSILPNYPSKYQTKFIVHCTSLVRKRGG
jgi:hypothetical protein